MDGIGQECTIALVGGTPGSNFSTHFWNAAITGADRS